MSESNQGNVLKSVFPNGKTSTKPGEITSEYVIAICRVYEARSASETEYAIEEYGITERAANDNLAVCYAEASQIAYSNMIARLFVLSAQAPQPASAVNTNAKAPVISIYPQQEQDKTEKTADDTHEPDNGAVISDDVCDDNKNPIVEDDTQQQTTIHKIDPGLGLMPVSSIGKGEPEVSEDDEITKARNMLITIVGKAHDCFNWTAGRILDEMPDVIVNFTPRYSGEKKDEKAALMALLPEATRRCKQST